MLDIFLCVPEPQKLQKKILIIKVSLFENKSSKKFNLQEILTRQSH
jgi:hypothetical protein